MSETTRPYCNSPWREVYVDVTGTVWPCCVFGRALGDVNTMSAEQIWRDGFAGFREEMMEGVPAGCEECFLQRLCREEGTK